LHHVVLERWSRGRSPLHAREPRVKIIALLCFLVVVATTPCPPFFPQAGYALLLGFALLLARLPLLSVLLRAAAVLPLSAAFAGLSLLAGDAARAGALVAKSYLSALAVLVVVGTTPVPDLLRGLESLGAPRFLILVVQFLYRYLFVISEQAQHMRLSAACRGLTGSALGWRGKLQTAAGAVSMLFYRSHARADGIHKAMLARGYQGRLPTLTSYRLRWADALFLSAAVLAPLVLRSLGGIR